MRQAYASSDVAYKRKIDLDFNSRLPVPPFWKLFSQAERVVMGLFYQAQLGGYLQTSDIKLAKDGMPRALPGPYQYYCLGDMDSTKFPLDEYDAADAEYLIKMMVDEKDRMPKDITQWIDLINIGKKSSDDGSVREEMDSDDYEDVLMEDV
jgi:hypothetical protein